MKEGLFLNFLREESVSSWMSLEELGYRCFAIVDGEKHVELESAASDTGKTCCIYLVTKFID